MKKSMIKLTDMKTGEITYSPILTASQLSVESVFYRELRDKDGKRKYRVETV